MKQQSSQLVETRTGLPASTAYVTAEQYSKLGREHHVQRQFRQAITFLNKARESGCPWSENALERWECWMMLGEYEEAWKESDVAGASFRGQPKPDHRVLIRCLRGLGDAIQFLRFANPLRERCQRVIVQAPVALRRICDIIPGVDQVRTWQHPPPSSEYDFELECSDLPYLFRTTTTNIPHDDGYLTIPRSWDQTDVSKVGLVWASSNWNPSRSLPLSILEPLCEIPGVELISLQQGPELAQLAMLRNPEAIRNAAANALDIYDTAAIIANLDLIISVDTMVAHLAGAMGKPVWTLLHCASDWRWMVEGSDSPWYRSMRLFRQAPFEDWQAVANRVHTALRDLMLQRCKCTNG